MQLPRMPNFNVGIREFDEMSLPLSKRLMEFLEEARNEVIAAMRGKLPLDRISGVPREELSPEEQRQFAE